MSARAVGAVAGALVAQPRPAAHICAQARDCDEAWVGYPPAPEHLDPLGFPADARTPSSANGNAPQGLADAMLPGTLSAGGGLGLAVGIAEMLILSSGSIEPTLRSALTVGSGLLVGTLLGTLPPASGVATALVRGGVASIAYSGLVVWILFGRFVTDSWVFAGWIIHALLTLPVWIGAAFALYVVGTREANS